MASAIKVVLRKKRNLDNTYPLALRITQDRKSTFFHLGFNLLESEWDASSQKVKKSHPNSTRLNNLILKKKAEVSDKLIDLQVQQKDVSVSAIRKQIKPKDGKSFFTLASQCIENMRNEGKYNRVKTDEARIKHFREFLDGADITFSEIDVPLLNRFRAYLKGTRQISERTVINHLIVIRTVYNQAIAGNMVDAKYYPFGKGKISIKFPDSIKIGLVPSEVKNLEQIDLSDNEYLNHARNIWLVSFYFAGMRISDVLRMKWSDFQDDRMHYTMGKNNKAGSLKTPEKVLAILKQYKKQPKKNDLIFPELKVLEDSEDTYHVQRKISYAVKRLNKALTIISERAGIAKPVTMHIARHTFGNISGDKIPVQMLQKLYRHSNITTTIGYQSNFINKTADDALDAVLGME
ncbi:tyrosine-type recombinase/integrase [Spirosoma sp. HMF4905]|uniref:Tyrosine-type recombinase/integrase n=1 Tax=Spirosoma arboris TaxID=2682092 RepID=A0A7K1SIP3_9BACT|nr:site-specific integrase [Spirosoma arboris]MVM33436.1 tyrosine-type recombinase/integrase [Spirosoma arboris]